MSRGRLLLVTFLGEARTVTSRRVTPGELEAPRQQITTKTSQAVLFN
jgi:hypothetical protein